VKHKVTIFTIEGGHRVLFRPFSLYGVLEVEC